MGGTDLKLSIIIPTYNRADYLLDTLRSLMNNDAEADLFEIIVVDNNSGDHTQQAVSQFIDTHPLHHIRCVVENRQGASLARNRGIKEAQTPLLLFIDDDEIAHKNLISAWITFFGRYPNALGGGGQIEVRFEDERPRWMSHFLMPLLGEHKLADRIQKYGASNFPFAGNMAYRAKVFEKYGMLKTNLGRKGSALLAGEEREFYHRLREHTDQIYHLPQARIYHRVHKKRMTKSFIRKQAIGLGQSIALQQQGAPLLKKTGEFGSEAFKSMATIALSACYSFAFQFSKAQMLIKFRRWIWEGYLRQKNQ